MRKNNNQYKRPQKVMEKLHKAAVSRYRPEHAQTNSQTGRDVIVETVEFPRKQMKENKAVRLDNIEVLKLLDE